MSPIDSIADLDAMLLGTDGRMRLRHAAELVRIPTQSLALWCHVRARYGVPSVELVTVLRAIIGDQPALEIGAGMGDLGFHLGIRMTDSALQVTRPEVRLYYGLLGQPTIDPPSDVERIDANEAVKKYRPKVVIASWVTQLGTAADMAQGIQRGPDAGVIRKKRTPGRIPRLQMAPAGCLMT
jgi:hypothetical protein